jgi:hypothetical protein
MLPHQTEPSQGTPPAKVISDFLEDFSLPEVKDILWKLVLVGITSENLEYSEPEARAELLHHHKCLIDLIEAVFIITANNKPAP